MNPDRIVIAGPFAPPNPLLYPSGRKTASHIFQIFRDGRKVVGGSFGPDLEACKAYALKLAAEKGLTDPPIIRETAAEVEARLYPKGRPL